MNTVLSNDTWSDSSLLEDWVSSVRVSFTYSSVATVNVQFCTTFFRAFPSYVNRFPLC
jgi:hypothetical protein